jgi:hypothetical protein
MSEGGFFSRIFGGSANEDETRIFSPQELQRKESTQGEPVREEPAREEPGREEPEEEQRGGFTVERAAEIIVKGILGNKARVLVGLDAHALPQAS